MSRALRFLLSLPAPADKAVVRPEGVVSLSDGRIFEQA